MRKHFFFAAAAFLTLCVVAIAHAAMATAQEIPPIESWNRGDCQEVVLNATSQSGLKSCLYAEAGHEKNAGAIGVTTSVFYADGSERLFMKTWRLFDKEPAVAYLLDSGEWHISNRFEIPGTIREEWNVAASVELVFEEYVRLADYESIRMFFVNFVGYLFDPDVFVYEIFERIRLNDKMRAKEETVNKITATLLGDDGFPTEKTITLFFNTVSP